MNSCERKLQDLQYELDREREARDYEQRRRYDEEEQARNRRKSEREEKHWARLTAPDGWREAFALGLPLISNEATAEEADDREAPGGGTHFRDWFRTVNLAKYIYEEEMLAVEEEIKRLRQTRLDRVAERIERETPNTFDTAQAFRDNNPAFLTYW